MGIHCQNCNAGRAYLEPIVETLETGVTLQTVRCIRCGWRVSRPVAGKRYETPRRPQRTTLELRTKPCPIPGCGNRYYSRASALGICGPHADKLRKWEAGKRTTLPPLERVNGVWIELGAPMPGIA